MTEQISQFDHAIVLFIMKILYVKCVGKPQKLYQSYHNKNYRGSFQTYKILMDIQPNTNNTDHNCKLKGSAPKLALTLKHPSTYLQPYQTISLQKPVLNKIVSKDKSFFCGYSDGKILEYSFSNYHLKNYYSPYQNTDVIDMSIMNDGVMLCCTHTEVTLFNTIKNKSVSLKGHEQTPIGVAAHPVSPLAVSVSNLVIHHDLRMAEPINVNFITPPVYGIKYFPDGQYFLLQGQPCRIGKHLWMRTLLNGLGSVSHNSKFILTNEMNGKLRLWDWRKSEIIAEVDGIKNQQNFQPVHFGLENGKIRNVLFLDDIGSLNKYRLTQGILQQYPLVKTGFQGDDTSWKMQVNMSQTTSKLLVYQHNESIIKCFQF